MDKKNGHYTSTIDSLNLEKNDFQRKYDNVYGQLEPIQIQRNELRQTNTELKSQIKIFEKRDDDFQKEILLFKNQCNSVLEEKTILSQQLQTLTYEMNSKLDYIHFIERARD